MKFVFCRYRENAEKIAEILTDEPNTGLQRAVFWTEYVIRHKGAPYFRSPALDMAWYQYCMLDILSLFLVGLFLLVLCIYRLLKHLKSSIVNKFIAQEKNKDL